MNKLGLTSLLAELCTVSWSKFILPPSQCYDAKSKFTLQNFSSNMYTLLLPYSQHGVKDLLAALESWMINECLKQNFVCKQIY